MVDKSLDVQIVGSLLAESTILHVASLLERVSPYDICTLPCDGEVPPGRVHRGRYPAPAARYVTGFATCLSIRSLAVFPPRTLSDPRHSEAGLQTAHRSDAHLWRVGAILPFPETCRSFVTFEHLDRTRVWVER